MSTQEIDIELDAFLDDVLGIDVSIEGCVNDINIPKGVQHTRSDIDDIQRRVENRMEDHKKYLADAMRRIQISSKKLKKFRPTPLRVVTMTVLCYINKTVDFQQFEKRKEDQHIIDYMNREIGSEVTIKLPNKDRTFYNSCTVSFKRANTRNAHAIKIFPNGKLHITGPIDAQEALHDSRFVCSMLDMIKKKENGSHCTVEFDVQMINTHFTVPITFDLSKIKKTMQKNRPDLWTLYDPYVHGAVNIHFMSESGQTVQVFMFHSGDVMITGKIKDTSFLVEAYDFIVSFIENNLESIKIGNDYVKPNRKRTVSNEGEVVQGQGKKRGKKAHLEFEKYVEFR
jgi:TATA-box binding protein (TBP) (component of TFIID and TFIIIB)